MTRQTYTTLQGASATATRAAGPAGALTLGHIGCYISPTLSAFLPASAGRGAKGSVFGMSLAALDLHVLVLNRLWQAVNICTARRAVSLLFVGHAQVVLANDGLFRTFGFSEWCAYSSGNGNGDGPESIHAIACRVRVPRVILLRCFDRTPRKEVKFTRQNIFARDQNTCQYCGARLDRRELNIDHVIPRHLGGETVWENVVCSCIGCNSRKANRTPEQAGLELQRRPRKPRWRPFVASRFASSADDSWRHFIDLSSWNVEVGD